MSHSTPGIRSIRYIALLEVAKGVAVLLAACGVLGLIHRDVQSMVEELVRHFHLNPANRFPRIFLQVANHTNNSTLWLLAGGALLYAMLRFIEAFGLWRERRWAEWFGILTGAAYIPIELNELLHGVTWPKVTLLVVNIICVVFLVRALQRHEINRIP